MSTEIWLQGTACKSAIHNNVENIYIICAPLIIYTCIFRPFSYITSLNQFGFKRVSKDFYNIFMHRLDHKGCVRVGDFGLAEDVYSRGYVREDSRTVKIPYKWMPPESLEDALFSELSDVVRTHIHH